MIRLPQEDAGQALGFSPGRKYESDGGPGIAAILDLLLQTQDPEEDRRAFFRALVVYWLLAAIDGHARNFGLFLLARGRCRLTPLYDILSAHPIVAQGQLHPRELEMAMAVDGKSRHYHWERISGRHWLSTAKKVKFPEREAEKILQDCATRGPGVIEDVRTQIPVGFPQALADAILQGVEATLGRI